MTAPAFRSQGDDSSIKNLLPGDPLGEHFLKYFNHGWRFILARTPEEGERPQWITEKRYPLEPRDLWELYKDPEYLLGLGFGSYTMFIAADIDARSKNHPNRSRRRFDEVLEAMEEIGLCRPIILRSSDSGGLHLYWFLPEATHSFSLAIAAKRALNKSKVKFRLIDGQLELFPNPKAYDFDKVRNFKPLRLPLQTGSCLLDWNLEPVIGSVNTLLHWADWSAEGQDLDRLEVAMREAVEWHRKELRFRRRRFSVEQFMADLQHQIQTGWTGYGQTNFLLWKFAMQGIIFERLQGEDLVKWMLETAKKAPGYEEFCRHQHEIEKRVKEWAKSAQGHYYPYPGNPARDKTFKQVVGEELYREKAEPYAKSKQRREEVIEQVKEIVALLKGNNEFPKLATKRLKAIRAKSVEVYKGGASPATLYQEEYKYLWHPEYDHLYREKREGVNRDSSVEKEARMPIIWYEREFRLKRLESRRVKGLQVNVHTEGFLLAPAWLAVGNPSTSFKGDEEEKEDTREDKGNQEESQVEGETSHSEGEMIPEPVNDCNLSLDTDLFCPAFLQIFLVQGADGNSTNSKNSNSSNTNSNAINSNPIEINFSSIDSNLIDLIGSSVLNLLVEVLNLDISEINQANNPQTDRESTTKEQINSLKGSNNKYCLYLGSSEAQSKNDQNSHNKGLSIVEISLYNADSREEIETCKPSASSVELNSGSESVSKGIPSDNSNQASYRLNLSQVLDKWQKVAQTENAGTEEMSEQERVSLSYRQAIKLKLQAFREAKELVHMFCKTQGLRLASGLHKLLEGLLKNCLLQRCKSPSLQAEAAEWLEAHRGEIESQANNLDIFWDYFGDLVF
jgi:hypothetical protein